MKNRIEVSWSRAGKELQMRAAYNEERDEWRVEKRTSRGDDYSYCDTTRNVWRCFEEQAELHL